MNKDSILRYISGDATSNEKCVMVEWLDADPKHMREFLTYRKLYDITLWQQNEEEIKIESFAKSKTGLLVRRWLVEATKIAAIFFAAILVLRFISPSSPSTELVAMQTIHVPAGQRAELTLVDGTKVWLNAKTTFTFPNHFSDSSRNVTLDGEGYFDVTTNKKQPFIVKTEKYNIKVWGTKFNALSYAGSKIFETSLLEGSVELLKPGFGNGIFIHPNERIFLKNERLVLAPITYFNHFLWKDGLISFDNESFPEMVTKLELYFDLKIEMKNDALLKYTCTGKFRTKDGVDHILKVLQLSNKFRFKIDEKHNIITIE